MLVLLVMDGFFMFFSNKSIKKEKKTLGFMIHTLNF